MCSHASDLSNVECWCLAGRWRRGGWAAIKAFTRCWYTHLVCPSYKYRWLLISQCCILYNILWYVWSN